MKILIAGDFAPRARLAKQIEEKRFSEVFPENLRKVIASSDFSFVNFESPIVEDEYKPIPKCGPNLRCTPEAAEAVKYAGFTGVTMANNHILDYGAEGLNKSIECCKDQGLNVVGVGSNLIEAGATLYLKKDGMTLAVINCCEHEFSIATDKEAGANPLNPIRQFYAIQEAKQKADYVLIIVHGGHEHFQLPSPRMVETYRYFIDAGADAVVNHHQHCYSGYETYQGKPIVYGLGNFLFDWPGETRQTWFEGYFAEIDFSPECISLAIKPYIQCKENPNVRFMDEEESLRFQESITALNGIIRDDEKLSMAISQYYEKSSWGELFSVEPYRGKLFKKLAYWGILPKMMNTAKRLGLINHINCESHRDKLLYALKKSIE